MAMLARLAMLVAAQSMVSYGAVVHHAHPGSQPNLRAPSSSAPLMTFSQGIWNNTITNLIQNEIHMPKARPTGVNKWLYVILAMAFGWCGCDRCFMGQVCLGCLKGFTCGGFMIWHLIDYIVAVVSALQKSKDINMMGYHAEFDHKTISMAFYVCIILLIWDLLNTCTHGRKAKEQSALQQKELEKLNHEVPMSHACLAHMPTMFVSTFRKAGVVSERPTVPELIAAFNRMDKNGDRQLDHDELKEGLKNLGASEETVDDMIKSADKDGDGKINYDEFLAALVKK